MLRRITVDALPILLTAMFGLFYVYFFGRKDPVLFAVFGVQLLRSGWAFRSAAKQNEASGDAS